MLLKARPEVYFSIKKAFCNTPWTIFIMLSQYALVHRFEWRKEVLMHNTISHIHIFYSMNSWKQESLRDYVLYSVAIIRSPGSGSDWVVDFHSAPLPCLSNGISPNSLKCTSCAGADDFLPILIYIVIHANPPQLCSNLEYIQRFRMQSRMVSESSYFFTQLVYSSSLGMSVQPAADMPSLRVWK